MKERFSDKTIILAGLVAGSALLLEKKIDLLFIAAVLESMLLMLITEIFRKNSVAWFAAVFSVSVIRLQPMFALALPGCIYSLLTAPAQYAVTNEWMLIFEKRKAYAAQTFPITKSSTQEKRFALFNTLTAFLLMVFGTWQFWKTGGSKAFVLFLLVTVSLVYLAAKELMRDSRMKQLQERYDMVRREAGTAIRARKDSLQQEEEKIYLATLQERNRIAREIHDNVGHMLTRSIVQMQAIRILNQDEKLRPYLDSVDETVNQAMLSIRRSVHELHDDSIDLSIMINELLSAVPKRFKVSCNTSLDSPVSSELKNQILAILKEAITNLMKYSKGDKVRVEVIEHTAFYRLMVWDNGKNAKKEFLDNMPGVEGEGGIGLKNICQRSRKLGGRATISSGEDGFTVLVTIPKKQS